MLRKICHIGNSYGVSIPKDIIEKLRLTAGVQVEVDLDEKGRNIIIKPHVSKIKYEAIDQEFASQVSDFIERYKPALKALAE
jgi:putative addiction module antidote